MEKTARKFRPFLFIFLLAAAACTRTPEPPEAAETAKAKNIILLIGDGMGPQQLGLLLTYARQAPHSVLRNTDTAFERILKQGGVMGMSMTHAAHVLVTDSAASGTQMATGQPAGLEMIGSDPDGYPIRTILETAKQQGRATGLVSDTRLTHATPAAFAAHQPHRSMENEIALEMLNTGPEVMLSGGLRYWIPREANVPGSGVRKELEWMSNGAIDIESRRRDNRHLVREAREKGYTVAFTRGQLKRAEGKILGLFADSALPDAITVNRTKDDPNRTVPTLREMAMKAIDVLSRDKRGFFLMIEAGQIDWAAHHNDTGTLLHEMLNINAVLNCVLDWTQDRTDTLVIVTADHETGGFCFSYHAADLPGPKNLPGPLFARRTFQPRFNFGRPEILDKIYRQRRSYQEIFSDLFDALPKAQQTPAKLMEIVNANTEFSISEAQAARILETERNPWYVPGHRYLGSRTVPKLDVNDAFYPYMNEDNRHNLLALAVATRQMATWATGTHTATPVPVFARGPGQAAFGRVLHHVDLAQQAIRALQ